MSQWMYAESMAFDVMDVVEGMRRQLDQLTYEEANSAKFDASDMSAKTYLDPTHPSIPHQPAARGLVVWLSGASDGPPPWRLGATWSMHTWRTDHDYDSLYRGLVEAMQSERLPDGRPLPFVSAYHSRICYSNQMHGTATLTIYFRL